MRSGCVNSESRLMLGNYPIDFILSKLPSNFRNEKKEKKNYYSFQKGETSIIRIHKIYI